MKKWIVLLVICLSITLVLVYTQAPSEVSVPPPESSVHPPDSNAIETKVDIPHWWVWSRQDWQKFQEYANQTEVIWTYNSEGKKIEGKVMVAGEPVSKKYSDAVSLGKLEEDGFYGFNSDLMSPIQYLEGKRKANCGGAAIITYCLFTVKGENVMLTSAVAPGASISHAWVEWTESDNNQWVIDFGIVRPREIHYQTDWSQSWVQWKPGEYEIHGDGSIIYFDS